MPPKASTIALATVFALPFLIGVASAGASRPQYIFYTTQGPSSLERKHREELEYYLEQLGSIRWNYNFQFKSPWGNFFDLIGNESEVRSDIEFWSSIGVETGFYIDVTECTTSIVNPFLDAVLQMDWMDIPTWKAARMNLDPSKSWFRYLKNGMVTLAQKYPVAGFNIDRADIAGTDFGDLDTSPLQQDSWVRQLLVEVQEAVGRPLKYVLNTLVDSQTETASLSYFLGSDGAPASDSDVANGTLRTWYNRYNALAKYSASNIFYLNPWMDLPNDELIHQFQNIMRIHNVQFFDDNKAWMIPLTTSIRKPLWLFTLPREYGGQLPSAHYSQDLGKTVSVNNRNYVTPTLLEANVGSNLTLTGIDAKAQDYYGVGFHEASTVQYRVDRKWDELAVFY